MTDHPHKSFMRMVESLSPDFMVNDYLSLDDACKDIEKLTGIIRMLLANSGFRGYGYDKDQYYCEYCGSHNHDYLNIEHRDNCNWSIALGVIGEFKDLDGFWRRRRGNSCDTQ